MIFDVARREPQTLVKSFQRASFAWSPDGRWMAYSKPDGDFNYDVWVHPIDGSRPAFNVSRHPDIDGDPAWSPDGKLLAYVGRHDQTDTSDIFYVWLQKQDDDKSNQDRRIEKALDKMKKGATATPKGRRPNRNRSWRWNWCWPRHSAWSRSRSRWPPPTSTRPRANCVG